MAYLDNVYAVVQIAPTGIPTYVRLSQNENGRVLNFAVSGDALPDGSTVALTGTKPDGAVYSASGTLADNVATFNEDEQLTAVAGEWDAKVEVTNNGNLIATGRIKFVIDADPSGGNIPSDSQLDGYIAEMLSLLDAGKAEAYGSPLVASTVAGMIDQSRVYVYTGSETGYTAGNWYYWNGSAWTSGGVYNAVAVSTDTTLSIAGKAADAKATGDALDELKDDLDHMGLSDAVKEALLNVVAHIAIWTDGHGQDYYDALETALYEVTYPKITAGINTGSHIICTDDNVSDLKQYITVTYYETEESTGIIIPSSQYTVSGTLIAGTSNIRVSYNNLTTKIPVTVANCRPSIMLLNATAPTNVSVGDEREVCINAVSNINRGMCVATEEAPHHLMYNNETESQYYPVQIPEGAKEVWMENAIQGKLFYSFYIMQWDSVLEKWIRKNDSYFRCCQEIVTFTPSTDLDSLTPWVDDVELYNDGTYYFVFNTGNTSGTYEDPGTVGATAQPEPGPISETALNSLQPHFVFNS